MGNFFNFRSKNSSEHQTPRSNSPKSFKSKKRKLIDLNLDDEEFTNSVNLLLNSSLVNSPSQTPGTSVSNSQKQKFKIDLIKPELVKPIRKKMKSTSQYIYKTLFINGENSDIVVKALNKEWLLHKLYLCQSPYFDSMFKGSKWKESTQSYIEIAIPDQNINERALHIAFGSFYKEEIEIIPIEVVHVLACASLFSLEGLINQCEIVMLENLNSQTILSYYDASVIYGVCRVTDKALKWLSQNLMTNEEIKLSNLNLSLFDKILSMKDLIIIQVETDLYSLCKKWLYLQLNKESNCLDNLDSKSWQKVVNEYFKNLINEKYDFVQKPEEGNSLRKVCLLEDPEFKKYSSVFMKIRIQHIMGDLPSLKLLYNDRIIPTSWIEPYYSTNWFNLLFVDQDRLSNEFEMETTEFETDCLRYGRILNDDQHATWRWVGFNYGLDLLVGYSNRNLTLKRNTMGSMQSPYRGLLSNKAQQKIYFILKLIELDANGNEVWSRKTELNSLDLGRNDEKHMYSIDLKVKFPILLNLFVSTHPFNISYSTNLSENQ